MQQQDLYARLELLSPELLDQATPLGRALPQDQSPVKARLRQWGKTLLRYFLGSKEPVIDRKIDLDGKVYFEVYDPVMRRRYTFGSEHEVRVWLERRYYQ